MNGYEFAISVIIVLAIFIAFVVVVFKYGPMVRPLSLNLRDGSFEIKLRKPLPYGREFVEVTPLKEALASAHGEIHLTGQASGITSAAPAGE